MLQTIWDMCEGDMTNIRDQEKFLQSIWDWTPFNDCFIRADGSATGIKISDIDGHVERNGFWLRIETTEKSDVTQGQIRSIKRDVARGTMVIILIGQPNKPSEMRVYRPFSSEPRVVIERVLWWAWVAVRGWFLWADANGHIDPRGLKEKKN